MTPLHKFAPLAGDAWNEAQQARLDAEWERVREAYNDGAYCRRCPYKHSWLEGHGERLRSCDILDQADRLRPDECPAVAA